MAQRFYADPMGNGTGYPIIGANSIQFNVADPVYINSSGFLDLPTSTNKVLGFSLEKLLMTSTNQTVAKVCPKYVINPTTLIIYPTTSSVGFAQTSVGEYAKLDTLTSGSITLSSTSGTTGGFLIVGIDPKGDGTTYEAVVKSAFKQEDVYASGSGNN